MKPKVGDKLFLVDAGNRAMTYNNQRYCEVTKVGRKYFTVTYGEKPYETEVEFHLDTRRHRTEYTDAYTLYESEQAWVDEIEKSKLAREISNVFRYIGYKSFTVSQLREVCKVLNIQIYSEDK